MRQRTWPLTVAGLTTPLLLTLAGFLVFFVVKELPPAGPCEEFLEPAERRRIAGYREGLDAFAAVFAYILLALIAVISVEHRRASGWQPGLTGTTRVAIAGAVILVAVYLVAPALFGLHVVAGIFLGLVGGEIFMLTAAWSTIRDARRDRASSLRWLLTWLWLWLLVGLPALLAFPLRQGSDFFCINGIV